MYAVTSSNEVKMRVDRWAPIYVFAWDIQGRWHASTWRYMSRIIRQINSPAEWLYVFAVRILVKKPVGTF